MGTYGQPARRAALYQKIVGEHLGLRDRLRALIQAGHAGADPRDVEAVRAVLWAAQDRTRS